MFLSILNLFCLFDVSGLTGILSILAVAQLLSRKIPSPATTTKTTKIST